MCVWVATRTIVRPSKHSRPILGIHCFIFQFAVDFEFKVLKQLIIRNLIHKPQKEEVTQSLRWVNMRCKMNRELIRRLCVCVSRIGRTSETSFINRLNVFVLICHDSSWNLSNCNRIEWTRSTRQIQRWVGNSEKDFWQRQRKRAKSSGRLQVTKKIERSRKWQQIWLCQINTVVD